MRTQCCYRCNEPEVIYEIYEDEVVILNFNNGNYYSLKNTAKSVWIMLIRGFCPAEIQRQFTKESNSHNADIENNIAEFIGKLIEDELIVVFEDNGVENNSPDHHLDGTLNAGNTHFTPPVLEKYTEMQELLLLDPIHEVSDTGWPERKKQSSS